MSLSWAMLALCLPVSAKLKIWPEAFQLDSLAGLADPLKANFRFQAWILRLFPSHTVSRCGTSMLYTAQVDDCSFCAPRIDAREEAGQLRASVPELLNRTS